MKFSLLFPVLKALFNTDHTNIQASREGMERAAKLVPPFLLRNVSFDKITVGRMLCEWVLPEKSGSKVVLYLHGGGYVTGSHRTHRGLVAQICSKGGFKGFVINYRLAPEHPFPAALEDALEAYRYLLAQGFQPKDIAIAGDSAGGGLSISLLYKLKSLGMEMPASAALICPWLDLTNSGESGKFNRGKDPIITNEKGNFWADMYAADADKQNPYISPLFGDTKGLPPVYIHAGGKDLLLSDATRMYDKMKAEGCDVQLEVYEDCFHVWHAFWIFLSEADKANQQIADFISARF
jgi:acetyl esterase/lipase